ncbi:MAG: polyprenyl synthetase family protein [Guyparkeria sp.]|uniref:polyprenyl synthetase family protein n=1 Tax=Guyparkeria sp. TaxID=2035736 RepID=UPI00397D251D
MIPSSKSADKRHPTPDFDAWLASLRSHFEPRLASALDRLLVDTPAELQDAIRYAALDGGKRLRPALVFLGSLEGRPWPDLDDPAHESLWPAAIAVELIHVYSLVHDDMPCMDDDDLRRGRPTLHRAFDEATAVLAGDAMQALAFATLADARTDEAMRLDWIRQLASGSGPAGMVGGQAIDLSLAGNREASDIATLADLHDRKTGALIRAALAMGGRWSGLSPRQAGQVDLFGRLLGRAFQIQDDILDVTGSAEALGKTPGKDLAADKCSYVTVAGLDRARRELDETVRRAHAALWELGTLGTDSHALSSCLDFVIHRQH